jgi:hypothetical protein
VNQKFYPFEASEDYLYFWFESKSNERRIAKVVEFAEIRENVFNLAFGDLDETGDLNDLIVSNNGDMYKILATVTQIVITFFSSYPDRQVYFTGSSQARTRLYRAILNREIESWSTMFAVKGVVKGEPIPFQSSIEFDGFLISRNLMII